MEADIKGFRGENRFLSNFWPAEVEFEGHKYPTVEHAYQAAKTKDRHVRRLIQIAESPGKAKRCARVFGLAPMGEHRREKVMYALLKQKFSIPYLRIKLLATENRHLEESNRWHDNWWGVCECEKCVGKKGQNRLGTLLMRVRREARDE